jgi:hypothetical protein
MAYTQLLLKASVCKACLGLTQITLNSHFSSRASSGSSKPMVGLHGSSTSPSWSSFLPLPSKDIDPRSTC